MWHFMEGSMQPFVQISHEELTQLRERLKTLDEERSILLGSIRFIEDRFAASANSTDQQPAPNVADAADSAQPDDVADLEDLPPEALETLGLSEAVLEIAHKYRRPMKAKGYMACLPKVGFNREVEYQNVYNALVRMSKKKRLTRTADAKFFLPNDGKSSGNGSAQFRR
jgi:hypothetical protein